TARVSWAAPGGTAPSAPITPNPSPGTPLPTNGLPKGGHGPNIPPDNPKRLEIQRELRTWRWKLNADQQTAAYYGTLSYDAGQIALDTIEQRISQDEDMIASLQPQLA